MNSLSAKKGFLIVGQGIAGTLLSYFLLQNDVPFKVIDKKIAGASSPVAAGIINPITGRRMVKSWRFEELMSEAIETYKELESLLGVSLFQPINILRALNSTLEQNEWDRRSSFPENIPYFKEDFELSPNIRHCLQQPFSWGEIVGGGKVDMPLLIETFSKYLQKKQLVFESTFDYSKLIIEKDAVVYNGESYSKIIFCEGAHVIQNPYFKYLPFTLTKGELLLVKIPDLTIDKILKKQIYLVPISQDVFWVGATNAFSFDHVKPTSDKKSILLDSLKSLLKVPFEVIIHQSGIRPTTSDKRPMVGIHPAFNSVAIFNGLGTKGASQGPFFAKQLTHYLLNKGEIDPDVNISRFFQDMTSD